MKRNSYIFISLLLSVVLFTSCITEDEYDNSPEGNFEALWQTIDRQYCFLDYKKQEYGLDWNEIYSQYKQRISKGMNNEQLFEVLADMLNELRDGHVNLSSKLEYSQYREWFDSYPANFSDSIQRVYLGKDYAQSSGMKYQIFEDNIAYIYCGSFQSGIGEGNLDEVLNKLAICDGLIIDVRNNSGGNLTTAEKLAARFTNEKVLVGYMSHKTGMKILPKVTIIGDKTGGGSGLPFSSELPNGWSVRFSASPMYDADMQHLEFGIDPDIKVNMSSEDMQRNVDTIIEAAREYLHSHKE